MRPLGGQLSSPRASVLQVVKNKTVAGRLFSSKTIIPALVAVWFLYFFIARSQLGERQALRGKLHTLKFGPLDIYDQLSDSAKKRISKLIIVAGHAVMRLTELEVADVSDEAWYLLPYQRNQGFPAIITSHVRTGVQEALRDASAVLMFSGGETRHDVGPTSEAASYYYLASEKNWLTRLPDRVFLEEYARDSFENLLFSVCRFREVQGYYPSKITVVGFDFKAQRYTNLHRKAIGYPEGNFTYIGVKSPAQFNQGNAERGEVEAYREFQSDMYGCKDPALKEKRGKRNPFKRTVPYSLACPEMEDLFQWCGPGLYDVSTLPWNTGDIGS
jgi:hypothetical protein